MGLSDTEKLERHLIREQQSPESRFSALGAISQTNDPFNGGYQSFSMPIANQGQHRQAPGPLHFSSHQQFSTGPAALMSPQPGGPSNATDGFMSPQSARASMTPSMPGFSFHPFPQTPPLVPHFLSPGLGPFSPTLGSTGFGQPITAYNPAPGAPVHDAAQNNSSDYNPPSGYFPSLDSLMSSSSEAPAIAANSPIEAPAASSARDSPAVKSESPAMATPDRDLSKDDALAPSLSSLLARRASTNDSKFGSPTLSVGTPPIGDRFNTGTRSASHSADKPRADFRAQQQRAVSSLENGMGSLSLLSQGISAFEDDQVVKPRQALNYATVASNGNRSPIGLNYPSQSALGKLAAENGTNARRASFETNPTTSKMAFGKSIWS